ncbi:glycerophosphodiester phosphodiesterase [Pseudoduganella sp. DS3]|uniref:glycerophosphodiester phosphodiesterase n=1 Tax=Pseudoduganella guangdongensis TaxID=2692179 RepID=A0A6N9HPQ6_9BURK|nr:glycerophosphodiester phosphodiesterase [Pseudoduganella guangdongensis]MYN05429.1 glycerophosphodiester phosphodiesterase [Pseudoduganella guangdongensis]
MKKTVSVVAAAAALAACGGNGQAPLPTLDGKPALVVAHRGASGYIPEQTVEAYARAIEQGADAIEPDVVSTKDGVLIARHDPNLAFSTDVADHPEFAARKRKLSVDGDVQEGWFASDFTLAEIKTLGGIATDAERPQQFNGKYKIATVQEIIDMIKKSGRNIVIYPETKNPTFHRQQGVPLEDKLLALLSSAGWSDASAPVFIQSFEPGSLKYMRSKGSKLKMVQLIDADDVDLKTGALTYAAPYNRPYDWAQAGDKRMFSDMVTPAGLAEIKTYADGIGPWKRYIVSVKGTLDASGKVMDVNGDGKINETDTTTQAPTTLVADAHKAGLFVHPYTFRNEKRRLAGNYKGDPVQEYKQFYAIGIDGLFTDFADTALAARAEYLKDTGR